MGLLNFDITKDYLHQQGQQAMQRQIIENILKLGTVSLEKIAELADVPLEYVQQLADELKKWGHH